MNMMIMALTTGSCRPYMARQGHSFWEEGIKVEQVRKEELGSGLSCPPVLGRRRIRQNASRQRHMGPI